MRSPNKLIICFGLNGAYIKTMRIINLYKGKEHIAYAKYIIQLRALIGRNYCVPFYFTVIAHVWVPTAYPQIIEYKDGIALGKNTLTINLNHIENINI